MAFELLCSQGPHQMRLISTMYQLLQESPPLSEELHTYMRKWAISLKNQSPSLNGIRPGPQRPKYPGAWRKQRQHLKYYSSGTGLKKYCIIMTPPSLLFVGDVVNLEALTTTSSGNVNYLCPFSPWWCLCFSVYLSIPFSSTGSVTSPSGSPLLWPDESFKQISLLYLASRQVSYPYLLVVPHHPPSQDQFLQAIAEIRRMEHMTAQVDDAVDRFDRVWDLWDKSEYGITPLNTT